MSDSYVTWFRKGVSLFFEYDTPKIVHIRSKRIGITSRVVQALILAYVIGYVIVYQKGYQQFEDVKSAVTCKVKGVTYTNFSDEDLTGVPAPYKKLYRRVWDATDYLSAENNAFFVTTNVIITPNQTQETCGEDPSVEDALCSPSSHEGCRSGESLHNGNGIMTGECVKINETLYGSDLKGNYTCEVRAWCPVEDDRPPMGDARALLDVTKEFTVLIKNRIEFPLYNVRSTNIPEERGAANLSYCLYDKDADPLCPVFKLDTIVSLAGFNYSEISVYGGVISVGIHWDCNLDWDFEKYCKPVYQFRRLDNPTSQIAPGWNFRRAEYYSDRRRTLYKTFGILFVLDVSGRAGKFNVIPLMLNLGAGLALLGVTTVICDIIVLYLMKDREIFREKKYLVIKGSDAFNVYKQMNETEEGGSATEFPEGMSVEIQERSLDD